MKKTFLKAAAAAAVVAATVALSSVAAFAATITSNDKTVLTGNYDGATNIKNSAVNCEVNITPTGASYEYTLTSQGERTGLIIPSLDTSSGKFKEDNAEIKFTTDGKFSIVIDSTSGNKKTTGLVMKKSDATANVELKRTNSDQIASAENLAAGTYSITRDKSVDSKGDSSYAAKITITVEATVTHSFSDGVITVVNDSSQGSVELTDGNGEAINVNGGKTDKLTGATTVNVKISPAKEYAIKSVTLGETELNVNDNTTSFNVDGDNTLTVTYAKLSKATESITYDLSGGLKAGDNGNGLYALEDMKCDSEGYVAGSSNPTLPDGMIPTAGAAIKIVPDTDGILLITYKQGKSSSKSGRCVESSASGAKQVYDKKFTDNDEIAQIAVTAGNEYYFYAYGGSKVKIKNIVFATDTAATKSQINKTKDYFCVDNSKNLYIIHPVTAEEMDAAKLYLKNGDSAVAGTETTEVYTGVTFGDSSSLESTDFGGSNIYVVKVTNASAENIATTTAFKWGTDTAA